MAKPGSRAPGHVAPKGRREERDRVFPPRTMTVRERAAAMAAARPQPPFDWRPMLAARFGVDGEQTPAQLDGVDPGEPDRYDFTDIQEALALAHMPLWLISAAELKLIFDYGYDTPSTFRLALLLLQSDPFQEVEGCAFGALLPAAAACVRWNYDPVADAARLRDDEARFRAQALRQLLLELEERVTAPAHSPEVEHSAGRELDIHQAAQAALEPPRRFARADANVLVARAPGGAAVLVSKHTPRSGEDVLLPDERRPGARAARPQPTALTFYIVGSATRMWAMAVDRSGATVCEAAAFLSRPGLEGAKAQMHDLFGVPPARWTEFGQARSGTTAT